MNENIHYLETSVNVLNKQINNLNLKIVYNYDESFIDEEENETEIKIFNSALVWNTKTANLNGELTKLTKEDDTNKRRLSSSDQIAQTIVRKEDTLRIYPFFFNETMDIELSAPSIFRRYVIWTLSDKEFE